MAAFSPSGVEFVAKNLSGYLSDLAKADKAQQALGKSAQGVGAQFAGAHTGASSFASRIGSMIPGAGSLASALGEVATVAGGIVAAQVFNKIAEGLGAFVSVGLEAVSSAQQLEVGLGALLTMNNLYEETSTTMQVATMSAKEWGETQADAAKKSDDLAFKQRQLTADINTQNATIQEQRQRIIQLADGLDKNQQVARLAEMELALEGMTRELADTATEQGKLNNLTQEYTTVTKTSFQQTMGFAEAQKLAKEQSQELLAFVDKLSITSPFEQEQVQMVTKYAVAADMSVESTKAFTAGFLDLAAAVGIGSAELSFTADQLLQVKKAGKLTAIDLKQLRTRGIDLARIIGIEMGMSVDEFNAKAEKSPEIFDELFEAVTRFSNKTFAGASSALATSVGGLRSTMSDIFRVGAKNLMRPLIEAVSPSISEMLGRISDMVTGPDMAKIGEAIPRVLFGAFESLTGGEEGGLFSGLKGLGLSSFLAKDIVEMTDMIGNFVTNIRATFEQFGARGVALNLLTQLGITHDAIALFDKISANVTAVASAISSVLSPALSSLSSGGIISAINTSLSFLNEHFEEIKGALLGLGVVIGAGVLASLGAAIVGLATPVAGLAAGAALLGAAWAGNWGGIRDTTLQAWAVIQPALTQLVTWLQTNIPIAIQTTTDLWNTYFMPGLMAVGDFVNNTLVPAFTTMWTWLGTNIPIAVQSLSDIWTSSLLPALQTGYDNFSLVVQLLSSLGELINAVINKALEAMAGIWQNILLPALIRVGNLLNDTLFPVFQDIGKTVDKDVSPILKDLGEVVLPLLQEGIEFVTEAIKDMIGFFEAMKDSVNSFSLPDILTPGSPPPMAYALMDIANGADLAAKAIQNFGANTAGVGKFIDDLNMGGFARAAGTGGGQWRNFRNILKNEIGASFEQLITSGMSAVEIMDKIKAVAHRFNFPPSFATEFAAANGLIEHLTSSVNEFKTAMRIENMGKMLQMGSTLSGIAGNFAGMLKEAGDSGQMNALRTFLDSGEQRFRIFKELEGGGTSEFFWDRNRAQREYNLLLEQQERQQDLINQQLEQQQKLSFLQSQLDLIKLGRELGGNIFAGITFGLDASVEDLLAATNAVTEAMINQINSDLQIASPSRVMARIGSRVIEGMARGIEGGRSMLDSAIRSTPLLNGSLMRPMAQPAYAGGNTYNTYNEFPMTVHTNSTPQGVVRQYEVKRSMYAS